MNRTGVSLVELAVAVALFGVLLLGAAGAAAEALRRTRTEARRGHALSGALMIADSLAVLAAPSSGERRVGDVDVRWTVTGAGGVLRVKIAAEPVGDSAAAVALELALPAHR